MRRLLLLASLLGAALVAAQGITLSQADDVVLPCLASGAGDAGTLLPSQRYVMRVLTADSTLCRSAACADGGSAFPAGTVLLYGAPNAGSAASCRSGSGTGTVHFTLVQ